MLFYQTHLLLELQKKHQHQKNLYLQLILLQQNIVIGRRAAISAATNNNEIVIGHSAAGQGANKTVIGNSSTVGAHIYGLRTPLTAITADTSLTVDAHAGKILVCNDADGKFTLPTIVPTVPSDSSDPNQLNNLGVSFTFVIDTAATDLDIKTDGTDKFVGGLYTGVNDATGKTFISGASNDVMALQKVDQQVVWSTLLLWQITSIWQKEYYQVQALW